MGGKEQEFCVLFADVARSTKLYEKLGDTEALRAVERCMKRMERSVDGFRGRIVKVVGDEMMALFNSADDAFHAAGDMQQRVTDLPPVSGIQLAVRVGFHHGPVREDKGEYTGDTVGTAARIAGLARAGQVLTSATTVALLPELLQLSTRDLEPASKGKTGGVHVFEVLWQGGEVAPEQPARAAAPAAAPARSPAPASTPAPAKTKAAPAAARFSLRHAGKVFVLDEQHPSLSLGRDAGSGLLVRDRRASRHHAKIERRGNDYVLTDLSTNGTYVRLSGEDEVLVHDSELVLRGSGQLSFAAPAASDGADVADFEFLN